MRLGDEGIRQRNVSVDEHGIQRERLARKAFGLARNGIASIDLHVAGQDTVYHRKAGLGPGEFRVARNGALEIVHGVLQVLPASLGEEELALEVVVVRLDVCGSTLLLC